MKVEFYDDIRKFINLVYPFLMQKEAENNIFFAILNSLKENPQRFGDIKPDLITVKSNNDITLVSIRTPPLSQLLSYTDDLNSIDILIEELINRTKIIPGILGFKAGVEKFVKIWCQKKNLKSHLIRNEKAYKLEKVAKETLGNREFRFGSLSDQSLILDWVKNFIIEALPETKEEEIVANQERVKNDIEKGRIFLLLDKKKVVSMARKAGKTPNGNLVNLVYTPPSLRRRGYATECVARLSKILLDEGNTFCFLYTDLMNPTSNSIYQKIGYHPVIDVDHYEFLED
jgi:RimJ/RimL family protein N-acetyltransferase